LQPDKPPKPQREDAVDDFDGFNDDEEDEGEELKEARMVLIGGDHGEDFDDTTETSDKSDNEEEEEHEDWDAELIQEKQGSSNTGSEKAPVTLDFKRLLQEPTQRTIQPNDSLLEYLDRPIGDEFVNPLWRELPKPPVPYALMIKRDDRTINSSNDPSFETPGAFLSWINGLARKVVECPYEIGTPTADAEQLVPELQNLVTKCERLVIAEYYSECVRMLEAPVHTLRRCCSYKGIKHDPRYSLHDSFLNPFIDYLL
jgi:hypothetical protein